MKIAVLGDTHFDVSNSSEEVYQQQIKFFKEEFFPYLIENDIKHIFQLGDFFDNKLKVGTYIQFNIMKDFFDILEKHNIVMWYFVGNHDLYYKDKREIFSLAVFEKAYHTHLKVIRNMDILKFDDKNYMMVPWMYDHEVPRMTEMVKEYKPDMIFGHFEIQDFYVSKEFQSTHGIDKSIFKDVPVISGHFHLKQEVQNIFYIGTPYQSSWTDYNESKGFYVLDTKDDSMEFIENTVSTKHLQIEINSEDKKMFVTGFSMGVLETDINAKTNYDLFKGHNVKIFIYKDNAFNKKVTQAIIEKCHKYKVKLLNQVLESEDGSLEEEILNIGEPGFIEFDVTASIKERLTSEYQKDVFKQIHEESLKQIED